MHENKKKMRLESEKLLYEICKMNISYQYKYIRYEISRIFSLLFSEPEAPLAIVWNFQYLLNNVVLLLVEYFKGYRYRCHTFLPELLQPLMIHHSAILNS